MATLLEVLRQDYIRTAWAKGLRERAVIVRHAMRNALGPVVTVIGVNIAVVAGGLVVAEQVFILPGLGRYIIEAVTWRDYPALQAATLFVAVPIIVVNIITDIIVGFLDPRIRLA